MQRDHDHASVSRDSEDLCLLDLLASVMLAFGLLSLVIVRLSLGFPGSSYLCITCLNGANLPLSEQYELHLGDCIEQMAKLPAGSVDMVLTDLPYSTTSNAWDLMIPMDHLWAAWKRVCKPGAPIVLFTQQPFTTTVAASNLKQLKTEWIWEKSQGTGFLNCHKYPLKNHENILVFCDQTPPYHPQKEYGHKPYTTGTGRSSSNYRKFNKDTQTVNTDGSRYPKTVLRFNSDKGYHPTQKPVALLEYFIRTYSNEGDTVLDCTMGSGSTIVAALNTNRVGIGIERDPAYFAIALERIEEISPTMTTYDLCSIDSLKYRYIPDAPKGKAA